MLRYVTSFIVHNSDHPYMAGVLAIGAILVLAGVAVELVLQNGLIGGFLVVYALIAFFLGLLGYLMLFGGKLIRTYLRETDASL